jgi:hypothetical protein
MAITKEVNIKVKVEGDQNVKKLGKSVKSVDKDLKDVKKTSTGLSGTIDKFTGGAITKFNAFRKGLGGVAVGFKGIGVAIAASGIGLLLIAISAITAAFKNTEAGQNKFAKLMGVIGAVVGNLVDLLAGLGEILIDTFTKPQEAWDKFTDALDKGYQFIKKQVVDRFSAAWTLLSSGIEAGILKMRIAWNEFTGDAEEANKLKLELKEVQEDIVKEVQEDIVEANDKIEASNEALIDVIVTGYNAAKDAVTDFIEEQIREVEIAKQIADQRAKADKIERALIVARAKANRDIAELRFKAEQRNTFTAQERIKFLQDAAEIEDKISAREIAVANLRLSAIQKENALSGSTKENLNEEAQLRAKVIELDTSRLNIQKRLQTQIVSFENEARAAREAEIKRQEERAEEIDSFQTDLDQRELERLQAQEDAKIDIILGATERLQQAKEDEAQLELLRAEILADSKVNLEQNTLGLIGALAKKGSAVAKGLAIQEIVRDQVKAVSQTISATTKANAEAAALSPLTAGQPFVTINSIQAGLGIAASAVGAAKSIKDILSDKKSPSGGGVRSGGGGGRAQAPAFNLVAGSGTNQIAEGLANEPTPLRAFVVSSEVTTAQSLDRNIEDSATFG